jgi:HAE1 family hydrophobic/amphiphilic exporter-1
MNIARLSITRPIFITCIVLTIVILGGISFKNLGLDLFPDMSFPTVSVSTTYTGAAPEEIDKQITKPIEDKLGTLSGVKHISARNTEGSSVINIEFESEVDIDKAAQDVRDKVSLATGELPDGASDPMIQKFDPDSGAVIRLALISDLPAWKIYDTASEVIKPLFEKVGGVGSVNVIGGTKREIQIELDQAKLNDYQTSMSAVIAQVKNSGSNVAVGKNEQGKSQTVFRSIGEFTSIDQIKNSLIAFSGDFGHAVSVQTLGTVKDGIRDKESIGYIYYPSSDGTSPTVQSCVYIDIVKQSGSNTVKVADGIKAQLKPINEKLKSIGGNSRVIITADQSKWIRTNVSEAVYSIIIGIILAVVVVFLFLGNIRSTIITAIAIPNSLLGAIIVMNLMGYTFNLMTLMAISLSVGLLVDDAIVVRENIFRKLEKGINPHKAAELGTTEVMLAVVATTLTIISVFLPVGMISGVIGKIFKQFAFTIVFAMSVSLFDALTVAPFLSAYFAGKGGKSNNVLVRAFERFQLATERLYERIMKRSLRHPLIVIFGTIIIFFGSVALLQFIKTTFAPSGDRGEFSVSLELPAGTSLEGTQETVTRIEEKLGTLTDLGFYSVTIGSNGAANKAAISVALSSARKHDSDYNVRMVRGFLAEFKDVRASVGDGPGGGGESPFSIVVSGTNFADVQTGAEQIAGAINGISDIADINSGIKKGSPEFRITFDKAKMLDTGVSDTTAGLELRNNISGVVVGQLHENGLQYDIRARLKPEQRDLRYTYLKTRVPNINNRMIYLSSIAKGEYTTGSSEINRRDKSYVVTVSANMSPGGAIGNAMKLAKERIDKNVKLPAGVAYSFSGEAENLAETGTSVGFALLLAILFIYMVLSSLYESFVTPFAILLAIPPALTGALFALFITGQMLNMMSMIGMVMLMGLVTKNSILLVDFAVKGVQSGLTRKDAILQAGIKRLRPILMTTFAMLAGTLPSALGIGEGAKMRQSMGIAIIGGLVVSTIVTLVVVPAVFEYIDRFRNFTESRILVREKPVKRKKSE